MFETKKTPEKSVFQAIQEKYSILEIASELNIHLRNNRSDSIALDGGGQNAFCVSPNSNRWYDFKLGYGGDITDLVAIMKYNGNKIEALKELAPQEYREKLDKIVADEKREQNYINLCFNTLQKQETEMARNALKYLHSRRITDETIKTQKIGFDLNSNRVILPFLNDDGTKSRFHTGRSLGAETDLRYKDATTDYFCKKCAFGRNSLKANNSVLFITEGIFDALTLIQAGFSVLCKCGGGSKYITAEILNICKDYEKIILAFDSDSTGEKYNCEFAKSLFERRIQFEVIELPNGIKDINEFVCKDGNIQDLIDNTLEGLEFLALSYLPDGKITKKSEQKLRSDLKKFFIDALRNGADNADIATLSNILAQKGVEKNFLDAVIKKAENGESENEIVSKLTEKYTLLFHEKTGFYEYQDDGVWHSQTDTAIAAYVKNYLGYTAKTRQINAVVKHLSIAANSNVPIEQFNKKSLFVFKNGTFDVNSGKLLEHSELDYSTILLDCDFDESAKCPTWLKFIDDVTAGDKGRAAVLQEFAGYVFIPDCRFAKILVLKGEGRNGKNVFADTLKFVFGADNCTSVKASKLGDNFQAIGLKDSLLNISSENQGSLRGSEDMLKAIATGDSITDSYKGKDTIEFNSRAKLILLLNKFPITTDDSDGFFSRLLFVNFVMQFVDNPNGELQKKIDVNLAEKLKKERAGIFNWCYQGAKRLAKQKRFTVIDDQQDNIKQFKSIINDVYDFVDDTLEGFFFDINDGLGNRLTRTQVYQKYLSWCEANGIFKPRNNKKFLADLRKVLHEKGIETPEYKARENGKFERFFDFRGQKIEITKLKPDNN